ncbi:hypothetical protein HOLleu_41673 [Holothuria leucospilota]|uniref:Uncharacterized protein n=1 Tax=Holothuria leucospilota TaxID=206669 RepID=A0A9Q1BAV7_HOLLE|nr:hypothetical protein HOLleu_41673 [Holothuria leucospilota]
MAAPSLDVFVPSNNFLDSEFWYELTKLDRQMSNRFASITGVYGDSIDVILVWHAYGITGLRLANTLVCRAKCCKVFLWPRQEIYITDQLDFFLHSDKK